MDHTEPTILITGATGAIGFETARRLAEAGAHVVVHGPTLAEASAATGRLEDLGVDTDRLSAIGADFADLSAVVGMAAEVRERFDRIDVLVHAAAVPGPDGRTLTGDGNELAFQVNHLASYLLTRLLIDRLGRADAPGRVVSVSSNLHVGANLDWADLQRARNYAPLPAYAQSQLALTMFTTALARRHPELDAVSLHPGLAESPILHHYGRVGEPAADVAGRVARLCDQRLDVESGAYVDRIILARTAPLAANPRALDRLWRRAHGSSASTRQHPPPSEASTEGGPAPDGIPSSFRGAAGSCARPGRLRAGPNGRRPARIPTICVRA
ncbi:SDR family NAD(P)-dependent oxidoreductase [Agromyces sp. LHK192]|uniref:SDR family NAD(P)-dependent oxidoreductase n=1 Tax=Agromyces sp. LHK192 TaxID=2498704 RepID=UPI000FD75F74|nr:SDR family NAD(P)-dependent oxidoreductase [Agromyces sp. LHK192]